MALISKRKGIVAAKRRRIIEEADERISKLKFNADSSTIDFVNDDQIARVTNFCQNPRTAVKMLGKIVQTIPNIVGPRIDE